MVLAAAAGLASCGQSGTPKANMKSDVDTLSYMVGVSNSQGLKDYVVGRLGVDTTYMADFVRGIKEGMKNTSAKEKAFYSQLVYAARDLHRGSRGVDKESPARYKNG